MFLCSQVKMYIEDGAGDKWYLKANNPGGVCEFITPDEVDEVRVNPAHPCMHMLYTLLILQPKTMLVWRTACIIMGIAFRKFGSSMIILLASEISDKS